MLQLKYLKQKFELRQVLPIHMSKYNMIDIILYLKFQIFFLGLFSANQKVVAVSENVSHIYITKYTYSK